MGLDNLPLWLVAASLSLNALYLRQLVAKIDTVYTWICGTPDKPGIADRLKMLENAVGITPMERRTR
jgi:hypothetical protein